MKKPLLFVLIIVLITNRLFAQPANDLCANAVTVTSAADCSNTTGNLYQATQTGSPTSTCNGTRNDVWYRFTVPAGETFATITVTLTSSPSSLTTSNTYIELYNAAVCGSVIAGNTLGCGNVSSSRSFAVTGGSTYYFRVFTSAGTGSNSTQWGFTVCVTSNNNCTTASTITPGTTVMTGSVFAASATGGIPVGCATGTPDDDVWYKFIAPYSYATITLSNPGANLAASGARMQLFSGAGACAGLASLACGTTANLINATGLTAGNTYFIRVYSAGAGQAGFTAGGSGFRISVSPSSPVIVGSGRMKEVYHQQILTAPQIMADPWEVTYGPDNNLWITEAKGYRIYKMNPTTGVRDTVLNISEFSTFFSAPDDAFNAQFDINVNNPQGGLAGLALHPKFLDLVTPMNYVYVSYVRSFGGGSSPNGIFYTNRLVRFTYNTGTQKLESPVSLCDTLPGSNDHNSQRMICANVGGTDYLFYAQGDMGAGQFNNRLRPNKAQALNSYEGKILRFNLVSDGDGGLLDRWIPNTNPYNVTLGVQSAVWAIGIRNNQGFAYDAIRDILYGASHGPYSDDEINIIQQAKNYGHPLVIGYAADDNYNGSTAGAAFTDNSGVSSCPPIADESNNAATIGATYKDPLFSGYNASQATVNNIWTTNPNNGGWPSEGWSGLDLYTHTLVPGWKNSLVVSSLKWGRVLKLKLGPLGTTIIPTAGTDTVSYYGSTNRFRDIALAPNGKDMYVIMDRSATTSGPSAANPVIPACPGCVQKYTFLGYADAGGKSSIPTAIDVADGTVNTCNTGTTVTIDNTNNNLWVPITGPDGNIMAEIHAMNQNLGVVTSSFYKNSGPIRVKFGVHYMDRNITISPAVTSFGTPVKVRLYISKVEFDALDADPLSGITTGIGQVKILKNNDPCSPIAIANTQMITPTNTGVDLVHGANGYVLQADITGFSSFYFATSSLTLPVELVYFKGSLQNNSTLLQWETVNENKSSHFIVERSIDGRNFDGIGTVAAAGTTTVETQYALTDNDVKNQGVSVIYYRLKMFDIDGAFKYSSIVTITLPDIKGRIVVFPNPAKDEVKATMEVVASGKVQWTLSDNSGRVIMQNTVQVKKGSNAILINLHGIPSGQYYLNVSGAGINQHVKLQKL